MRAGGPMIEKQPMMLSSTNWLLFLNESLCVKSFYIKKLMAAKVKISYESVKN